LQGLGAVLVAGYGARIGGRGGKTALLESEKRLLLRAGISSGGSLAVRRGFSAFSLIATDVTAVICFYDRRCLTGADSK
jgi:hypothetical protein